MSPDPERRSRLYRDVEFSAFREIDVVFSTNEYLPQHVHILIDCRHIKSQKVQVGPTCYNLAYAVSEGYQEILQAL